MDRAQIAAVASVLGLLSPLLLAAKPFGPAFPAKGLEKISIPVEIVSGDADENVPVASSAKYFSEHIPRAKLTLFPGGVSHYVFLPTCTKQDPSDTGPALPGRARRRPGIHPREDLHNGAQLPRL